MKRKYIVFSVLVLLGLFGIGAWALDAIHASPEENQAIYDKARMDCESEIWLIYNDIGPVIPQEPQRQPYPNDVTEITGKSVYDYACNKNEALNKVNALN